MPPSSGRVPHCLNFLTNLSRKPAIFWLIWYLFNTLFWGGHGFWHCIVLSLFSEEAFSPLLCFYLLFATNVQSGLGSSQILNTYYLQQCIALMYTVFSRKTNSETSTLQVEANLVVNMSQGLMPPSRNGCLKKPADSLQAKPKYILNDL